MRDLTFSSSILPGLLDEKYSDKVFIFSGSIRETGREGGGEHSFMKHGGEYQVKVTLKYGGGIV